MVGHESDVSCEGMNASCEIVVADGGDVHCESGATCHIVCEGECDVACVEGATCTLRCPGDSEPRGLMGEGGCGG
jgi:hypothetical protein